MKKDFKPNKPILHKVTYFSDLKQKISQESEEELKETDESLEEKNKASLNRIYQNLIKATEEV